MWFTMKRRVRCVDCGFLALGIPDFENLDLDKLKLLKELGLSDSLECTKLGRDNLATKAHPDPTSLSCARHVWSGFSWEGKSNKEILDLANVERKCPYYFPYQPGYSPVEHRELQREKETRTILLIGMLSAALIGAAAAILARFIARV